MNLPTDLVREICFYLEPQDIKKIDPPFYSDPTDVYWKMMAKSLTDEEKPNRVTHQAFYYQELVHNDGFGWDSVLLDRVYNDEIFLTQSYTIDGKVKRYIDIQNYHGTTVLLYVTTLNSNEYIRYF